MLARQEYNSPKNRTMETTRDNSETKEKKSKKILPELKIEEGNSKTINQRRILRPSKTQNSV